MIEYEPIGWVNGEEAETTPLNADNLNHMDEGIQAATNYASETRDIADDTAARLALQEARLDVIVANMSTNTRTLTQAEYDSLTEAEKNNNTIYFISDGGMNDTTKAASIEYDNERSGLTGETVQAAIDENASAVAALNSSTKRTIRTYSNLTTTDAQPYVKIDSYSSMGVASSKYLISMIIRGWNQVSCGGITVIKGSNGTDIYIMSAKGGSIGSLTVEYFFADIVGDL